MATRRWPLVGNALAFRFDSTAFLLRIAREQGDIATFHLGSRNAWLLSHPDHVRAVLVDHAEEFGKGRLIQRARRLLGDGLLTSEGEFHRTQRRMIQPAFSREQLRRSLASTSAIVAARTASWNGQVIDMAEEMDAVAMEVVSRALLGGAIETEEPELSQSLRRLARWVPLLLLPGGKVFETMPLPFVRRLGDALRVVERAIARCVADAPSDAPLLEAMHGTGDNGMPARQARDEVMTIFLAGHDTTAATLIWTWLVLGNRPDLERKLHDELDRELGDRDPVPEDIPRLHFLGMLIDEVLRLYPPIGRVGRTPLHDVTLDGLTLTANSSVFVSPFVTHRDPRWYPDPERFAPERWEGQAPGRPRFAWFPFGAGPRSCIGEHFARMVTVLSVATIARKWRFRQTVPGMPRPRSLLTVKPAGSVRMAVTQRGVYPQIDS